VFTRQNELGETWFGYYVAAAAQAELVRMDNTEYNKNT